MEEGSYTGKNNNYVKNILTWFCVVVFAVITVASVVFMLREFIIGNNEERKESRTEIAQRIEKEVDDAANNYIEKVKLLLEQDPVDIDTINELHDSTIEYVLSRGFDGYVTFLTLRRNDLLTEKGLEREALDALLAGDYSMVTGPDQYRIYDKIIVLAEKLGESEVLQEYRSKQSLVSQEYEDDYRATDNYVMLMEAQGGLDINNEE